MRQLLRKALAQQQACGGLLLEHQGLCWSSTSWKASGANLVVDAGQLQPRRMALMRWMATRVPVGWLLWPDQQPGAGRCLHALGSCLPRRWCRWSCHQVGCVIRTRCIASSGLDSFSRAQ